MRSPRGLCPQTPSSNYCRDVVDRVVDWGRGHSRGSRLLVTWPCSADAPRGSARAASGRMRPTALARRAAHPGRRVEVDPDDDPLQYVGRLLDGLDTCWMIATVTMRRTRRTARRGHDDERVRCDSCSRPH